MSKFQQIICGMLLISIMGGLTLYANMCTSDKTLVSGFLVLLTYIIKKVLDMFEDMVLGPSHDSVTIESTTPKTPTV